MCGIAGEVRFDGSAGDPAWSHRAAELMRHRGPDGQGVFDEPGITLVHRRLSIIDIEGGTQPMAYADGRYWITYNGEIYNYRELRAELEARGHAFRTRSDTEVILAAYAAWGVDALPKLRGIFAFGLWDRVERALLLARDHLGVKPLLFHADATGVRFASEFKALLAHPAVARRVDPQSLRQYLALGYVMAPRTIVAGVAKLPAGRYLRIRAGRVHEAAYWDLAAVACDVADAGPSDEEHTQAFDALLDRTIAEQMVSDVPLGSFLSGGLDSSAIAFYANRHAAGGLQTFSMGFEEASFSELAFAEQTATHLRTVHRQEIVHPKTLDQLGDLVWFYDEPLGDTSIVPTYDLAHFARRHVTVVLSGDGSDEILAGYDTYVADRFQRLYARLPGWLHRGLVQPLVERLPSSYRKVALDFKIRQFVAHAHTSLERAHFGWRRMLDEHESDALIGTPARPEDDPFLPYAEHFAAVAGAPTLNQLLYVDLKTWLVDDILSKVDRATMASSLEARVPFLAPPVVEAALRLPMHLKLRGLERKVVLRRLMRNRLPAAIVRRKKRGFNAPVSQWLRGPLRHDVSELFRARAGSVVDFGNPVLQQLWAEHCSGAVDHGHKLWTVLSLALWERRVLQ
jgi:asparagine synthase (glutamine-hydrolysing)